MEKTQSSNMQQRQQKNQNTFQRSSKEKNQDVKNAADLASINRPNHPNT